MYRRAMVITALIGILVPIVTAQNSAAGQRRDEILKKAEALFGERYIPPANQPLRLFDPETQSGPPDEVIYRYGASYIIQVVFANDGSLARVSLIPETDLHRDDIDDAPQSPHVTTNDMAWLLERADELVPIGKPQDLTGGIRRERPRFGPEGDSLCFQSGANNYCSDSFEGAVVGHYWRQEYPVDGGGADEGTDSLKNITIAYKQAVVGGIVAIRKNRDLEEAQDIEIGNHWYTIRKASSARFFGKVRPGDTVTLTTWGCDGTEFTCSARSLEATTSN